MRMIARSILISTILLAAMGVVAEEMEGRDVPKAAKSDRTEPKPSPTPAPKRRSGSVSAE